MKRLTLAVLAVLAVGGSVAYATVPATADNRITGCYEKHDGALRLIDAEAADTCRKSENEISWSGSAAGRTSVRSVTGGGIDVTRYATVLSMANVEPGAYAVQAKVVVSIGVGSGYLYPPFIYSAGCDLQAGGDVDHASVLTTTSSTNYQWFTLPLQLTHTFTSPGSISLACSGAPLAGAGEARISTIKVASETRS